VIKLRRTLRALFLKILDRCNEVGSLLHGGKILTIVEAATSEI
jgi:hypothetical protein